MKRPSPQVVLIARLVLSGFLLWLLLTKIGTRWSDAIPDPTAKTFAWLAGALADVWGPRRVMVIGLVLWGALQVLFLGVALPDLSRQRRQARDEPEGVRHVPRRRGHAA